MNLYAIQGRNSNFVPNNTALLLQRKYCYYIASEVPFHAQIYKESSVTFHSCA